MNDGEMKAFVNRYSAQGAGEDAPGVVTLLVVDASKGESRVRLYVTAEDWDGTRTGEASRDLTADEAEAVGRLLLELATAAREA